MKIIKIIESKRWVNKLTGQTASIYGSIPYVNELDKLNWLIETNGYTWLMSNGTIGFGRKSCVTYKEAEIIMNKFNKTQIKV